MAIEVTIIKPNLKYTMKLFSNWKNIERIFLLERLELYMSAGMTLDRALATICESSSPKQKIDLEKVGVDILAGRSFAQSFEQHIGFSKTIASLIEHGQSSGGLVKALDTSRALLEKQGENTKRLVSALIYPGVIGIFSVVIIIGLVRGVMPQITPMLRGLNVELPLLTKIVIYMSENMMTYGMYVAGGIIMIVIITAVCYVRFSGFKFVCQSIIQKIPIVGRTTFLNSLSLFLQSFGSLVDSGAPAARSYSDTSATVTLLPLRDSLQEKLPEMKKGVSCGRILSGVSKRIPVFVSTLVLAGEASGTLGSSLMRAASIIEKDIEHSLKRMTSLIEPLMMVGMGTVVGSIALSIMMPIYDISKALQH